MIERHHYIELISKSFRNHKIVALLGARQSGKTTLAKTFAQTHHSQAFHFFDMEDPFTSSRFTNPRLVLDNLEGLIIIDEIQRAEHLFPLLRVLADQDDQKKYLILGSASPHLIHKSSESLAGRIAYVNVHPFHLGEVHELNTLLLRGGFPKSFLAEDDEQSWTWRENYIRTFLERDLPQLGIAIPPLSMRRFWMMLAHVHGQIFNASDISRSMGITDKTVKNYLDILSGTFMIRQLQPWHENITKRQVKRPKIYFRDTGILNFLSNLSSMEQILIYPKLGSLWEGFALEQVIQCSGFAEENCFFWATHQQAEIDLLVMHQGKRLGFEFKYTDVPKMTPSIRIAQENLRLDEVYIVYPGSQTFNLDSNVKAVPLNKIVEI